MNIFQNCTLAIELVRDASTYSLHYKIIPISTFSAFQIDDRLFKMQPRAYMEVCHFLYCSYGLVWVQLDLLTAFDKELTEVAPYWGSALTCRHLLNGVSPWLTSTKFQPSPTI